MNKMQIAEEFQKYIEENGVSSETVNQFIRKKQDENANMMLTVQAMKEYAQLTGDELLVSEVIIQETDFDKWCGAVMANLSKTTQKMYGSEVWEKIFKEMQMPKPGWTLDELSDFTYNIEQKYLSAATREKYECAHKLGGPFVTSYKESDRKELTLEAIDLIIEKMNAELIDLLKEHNKSGELFFNQKIDDSVMKEYETGKWNIRREGLKIIFMKIPFLMSKYLTETDNRMKRYYACHCPWARKSILKDQTVSPSFCYCSLGHDKQGLENAFGRQLEGRVICSVLDGNSLQCVFEVDIPDAISSGG